MVKIGGEKETCSMVAVLTEESSVVLGGVSASTPINDVDAILLNSLGRGI
jgi:hypothetical protein